MKRIFFAIIVSVLMVTPVNASTDDFYFSDFTGDYYLQRDDEGISHLKVVESVTAEFPNYNQNKGICRMIPFTNQDGANVTLPDLSKDTLTLTRNGEPEPIYSIKREDNYYSVCTGDDDYLTGTQVYTFEYKFMKVVTDFHDYQELYWDTNGNGSVQRFDQVTARVHFEDGEMWTNKAWCYVGKYGANGQERCEISRIDDGVEFKAVDLEKNENLTFDVEIPKGTFVIPEPERNYNYVWAAAILGAICMLIVKHFWGKYLKSRDKEQYYKSLFVKPEYQPHAEYSLAEMEEVYIGKKEDLNVAMLLELVVKRKIELKRGEKQKWVINIKDLKDVGEEYISLLSILNGGTQPVDGDSITVKTRSATSSLIKIRKSLEKKIVEDLKKDELVENKFQFGGSKSGLSNIIVIAIVFLPFVIMACTFVISILTIILDGAESINGYGQKMIFKDQFYPFSVILIVLTALIIFILIEKTQKYIYHTLKGLDMARYMDGLKVYIEMAEAERMKLLQSVEGADTSAEGIVKLYEKLLPYAAVFGLEDSWMNEMREYCKVEDIEEPDYLMSGLAASELTRGLRSAARSATSSTVMSSSGGGSSSGFSGGGGGGFSGGGGGGGGFSGR